jgi:hypothetical protein
MALIVESVSLCGNILTLGLGKAQKALLKVRKYYKISQDFFYDN